MPDPAQPEARISETGQGAPVPAATARQPETVQAVNRAALISFASIEPAIELPVLA